jgi:hypothetical protein
MAEKIETKSSTQQLLDEIRKLREINEILLVIEQKKQRANLFRFRCTAVFFGLSLMVLVAGVSFDSAAKELLFAACFSLLILMLWMQPAEWKN